MDSNSNLHVLIFPWLAFGHLIPGLQLAKALASKGVRISFVSTPKNIQRLPPIPQNLSSLITFISLPLPPLQGLPENAESTTDVPPKDADLLMRAFDGLKPIFAEFLQNSSSLPHWIIHDYPPHWLPELAAKYNIPCVYFGTFNAASLSFLGPPKVLLSSGAEGRFTGIQSFLSPPKWIPFQSDMAYRFHEILPLLQNPDASGGSNDGVSPLYRFGIAIGNSEFLPLRSCVELEKEWIELLSELLEKPVVPVGSLHPSTLLSNPDEEEIPEGLQEWLQSKKDGSVLYVAFGTEAALSQEQVTQLATGLEKSAQPFFWVLRKARDSTNEVLSMLPEGFLDRVKDQGVVWTSWIPQVKMLAHRSIGGVLTHCGWSSLVESLGFGRALILLPLLSDQGLNARLLQGKKLGFEIPRNLQDGSFTSEAVAESVRMVMVEEEGEVYRSNAREMVVLGDEKQMGRYVDDLIGHLQARKKKPVTV